MSKLKKVNKMMFLISCILLFSALVVWCFRLYECVDKTKKVELDTNKNIITNEKENTEVNENNEVNEGGNEGVLNISPEANKESEEKNIENILLLGVDKQENVSDTIIVASLRRNTKSIKFISIMRDTYVYQGKGKANKINYAYNYGGVEGSVATVNKVFNLDISKYIKVSFEELVKIVDYVDGVEVYITTAEKDMINRKSNKKLDGAGNVVLNGEQALAYSRIRSIDSDYKRTERQRNVIISILKKAKEINALDYPEVISQMAACTETNLTTLELIRLGTLISDISMNNVDGFRIPLDGTTRDNTEGVYHLDWDEEVNKKALYDYIYN